MSHSGINGNETVNFLMIFALTLIVLISMSSANAVFIQKELSTTNNCTTNTTLVTLQQWLNSNGTPTSSIISNECPYGCNTQFNACRSPPFIEGGIAFLIIVMFLLFIFKIAGG